MGTFSKYIRNHTGNIPPQKEEIFASCVWLWFVCVQFIWIYWVGWKQTEWIGMSGKCFHWFTKENGNFLVKNKLKSFCTFTIRLESKNYMWTKHGVNRMLVKSENGFLSFDSTNAAFKYLWFCDMWALGWLFALVIDGKHNKSNTSVRRYDNHWKNIFIYLQLLTGRMYCRRKHELI